MRNRALVLLATAGVVVVTLIGPTAAAKAPAWRVTIASRTAGLTFGAVDCVTARDCWVLTQHRTVAGVMATTNGGLSWHVQRVPTPQPMSFLTDLSCPSVSECVAVGFTGNPEIGSAGIAIVTHDAGATWASETLPSVVAQRAPGVTLTTVSCTDVTTCVATGVASAPMTPLSGSCGTGCTYAPGPTSQGTGSSYNPKMVALSTLDGGAAWTYAFVDESNFMNVNSLSCTAGACQAAGFDFGSCVSNGTGQKCGATGAVQSLTAGSSAWTSDVMAPAYFQIFGVSCVTALECWTVGSSADSTLGHGVVMRTLNAGDTWTRERVPPDTNALLGVSCSSNLACVAVGAHGTSFHLTATILVTHNGGASWVLEPVTSELNQLDTVSCVGAHCVATGSTGIGPSMMGAMLVN